jgi:uncharacterized membrane protein YidH (DUF202 family)
MKKKYNHHIKLIAFGGTLAIPSFAFAQTSGFTFGATLYAALNTLLAIMVSLGVIFFLVNALRYLRSGGNPEARSEYRNKILWSIVALFVMVSVWGLVNILKSTFALNETTPIVPGLITST